MKPYHILTLLLFSFSLAVGAQTKLIAHKGHSGSKANFKKAYSQNLFNLPSSDFGEAPRPYVVNVCLDSVLHVSDSVAVLYTSHCSNSPNASRQANWAPGLDTVKHHHLFSGDYSLEEVKQRLETEYYFSNSMRTVKFIGFDDFNLKKNPLDPAHTLEPKKQGIDTNNPLVWLFILVCISIFAGLLAQKSKEVQ